MSSKQEIKVLYSQELVNTPQYQIVMAIKQSIINEIAVPNVQPKVIYNFQTAQNEYDIEVIKVCMLLEFGFSGVISSTSAIIDMANFLN